MTDGQRNESRPSLGRQLWADIVRMAALTAVGFVGLALFEYVGMLYTTPAPDVRLVTALRLIFVDIALLALLWACIALPLASAAAVGTRLSLWLLSRERGRAYPGLLAPKGQSSPDQDGGAPVQTGAGALWGLLLGAGVYVGASSYATFKAITYFKEPQLTAFLLAIVQLIFIVLSAVVGYATWRGALWMARQLRAKLGRWNPFGQFDVAAACVTVLGLLGLKLAVSFMPQLAPKVPWRQLLDLIVIALGIRMGVALLARRGHILPVSDPRKRRLVALACGIAILLIIPLTLFRVGADHEAKSVAITGSPLMESMVDGVRKATDFDRDGYGSLLGENDCEPFKSHIHPLARDIPDNGIDEDCNGRDFSLAMLRAHKKGERMDVPEAFQREWNFLLITVDTLRYDHLGFGGYKQKTGRDTSPELDKLVERSVSFNFAQAPSAGTMASIPAILTSKFFHSGVALDYKNRKKRMPPILKPENLLISELLSDHGYYTGAITTHEYFNNWGMEQGMDTYDNEIGKKHAPRAVTSHKLTDKILAWVGRNNRKSRWFLWAHYLDPHGRYVEHPGEVSYGTTEEDIYDGEIHFTDKHIGRLLRELAKMPGMHRTIIMITSDHGDGFKEHGFINHGQALYRELLHVPLIVYIPELPARLADGAVSPMDLFPTIADLAGIDISDLNIEGESLVPQLFYGQDRPERVVFAETNWPRPIRAAVSRKYKLIYKLQANVYEFYDLVKDPWEQKNIYQSADKKALGEMKEQLDSWLERVYYDRDPIMNENAGELQKYLVEGEPHPQVPLANLEFDQGHIQILGFDRAQTTYSGGDKAEIFVYFKTVKRPTADYRFQLELWPLDGDGKSVRASPRHARSGQRPTARGLFPSSRWRPGEVVRDGFKVKLPKTWTASTKLGVGLRVTIGKRRKAVKITGAEPRERDANVAVLGDIGFIPAPAPPAPAKPGSPQAQPTRTGQPALTAPKPPTGRQAAPSTRRPATAKPQAPVKHQMGQPARSPAAPMPTRPAATKKPAQQ